ncbi:MAG: peptidyl-prolyl cis-trans isomerase [Verrucomicrobia bacterium]|nr:peptidyl-prolyl cis-trans isomerase [Verrucomicrobiota bacterium]
MFGTIRKHQKWLWIVVSAVTIITFVIFFTPTVGRRASVRGPSTVGEIHGRPISLKEYRQAWLEAHLSFFFRYRGVWPEGPVAKQANFIPEREARNRLVLLDLVKQAGIKVGDKAAADWLRRRLADPSRPESAKRNFLALLKNPELTRRGITAKQLAQFARHEAAILHLIRTAGVLGDLITPREAGEQYKELNERIDAEAVVFESTNYWKQVKPTPEALLQYYSNHLSRYRIPERVAVSYVRFPITNYLAQAEKKLNSQTNLTAALDQEYARRGADAFLDAKGQPLPPEKAKQRIKQQWVRQQATILARRDAAAFGSKLFEMTPMKAENLAALAAKEGLKVGVTRPFPEATGPLEIPASRRMIDAVFQLNEAQPFTSPIVSEDGVYILALKQRLPSEIPPFESVKARVERDFRLDRARELAREAGKRFHKKLITAMSQGKSFRQVCLEENVPVVTLPRFSQSSTSLPQWDRRLNFYQVKRVAADLKEGDVSDLIPTQDGGFVLHVVKRHPVTEQELKEVLPEYMARLARTRESTAFREWYEYYYRLSGIHTPLGRDERPQQPTEAP